MNQYLSHQQWTRRQALRLMAGVAGSIGLHACAQSTPSSSSSTASSLIPVRVGSAPWIGCVPLYIAQEKGFFKKAGLDLNIQSFGTNLEGLPAFSAGQLQGMAPMTIAEASTLLDEGVNLRIVGVMNSSAGGDAILARNSVTSIEDFKGREVAVQKGGVSHFFLLQVLAEAGLGEQDIKIIDTNAETAATAYEAGNVEIACTYSPFLEKANAAQPDGRIIYDSSKMPTAIIDLYVFNANFVEQQPQAVEAFLKSLFEGLDFLNSYPQEARTIAAKYLDTQPEDVEAQLRGVRIPDLTVSLEMLGNPQSELYLLEPMTAMAEFLKDQGQIQTIPEVSRAIDPTFLQSLSANA